MKTYQQQFGEQFTQEKFEDIKKMNENRNRKCWMCVEAYKKDFNELSEPEKYHLKVCTFNNKNYNLMTGKNE